MSKFMAGVMTTIIIYFVFWAVQTKDTGCIVMAFAYFGVMCLVYGVNFGVYIERVSPSKKEEDK